MRAEGYEIVGLGEADMKNYGIDTATTERVAEGVTVDGENFGNLLLANTPLYPINHVATVEKANVAREAFDYLLEPENFEDGSKFVFTHLLLPHPPFMFDADGELVAMNNFNNWRDKQFYLGQYQYTEKMMLELADSIIENDPTAVILFTSDHAARASTMVLEDGEEPMFTNEDKARSFQALYMGGEEAPEIEGKSGMNVMVTMLNELFGTSYPEVPFRYDPRYLVEG
jgi:hypothetical protein